MRSSSARRETYTLCAALVALLVAFACKPITSADSALDDPEEVVVIGVEPSSVTIVVGETVQLTAVARGKGEKASSGSVLWSSSDAAVAKVTQGGLVTGMAEGTAAITAAGKGQDKQGQGVSASIRVEGGEAPSPSGGLVIGLEPATYDTAQLTPGDRYYVDRDFTVGELPDRYRGWLWVRTANDDKAVTAGSFVSFELRRPAVVSVAYDKRGTSLPQWLRDWTEAPEGIGVSDGGASPLRVFHKEHTAGPVTLGGNLAAGASGAQSNYVVLLLEESQLEPRSVRISPASVHLDPGAAQQFSARVEDQVGNEVAGSLEWSATGGTISAEGLYTAGDAPGSYRVIARDRGHGLADTARVDVGASGAISDITFDWSTYRQLAGGSDNWPLTWCEDGHQYTSWGDGGGFGGTNNDGRVSLGFARIEGDYPNITGVNVWGGKNPENQAQFGGKSTSILCIDGTLYAWRSDGSNAGSLAWKQIIRSTDKGAHWEENAFPRSRLEGCVGCPGLPYFINYGQNYTANRDGYVYIYTIRVSDPNTWEVQRPGVIWLARARVSGEAFGDTGNWEWLTSDAPTWGALADRVPVITDDDGFMRNSALYVPGLDRYVMVANHTARNLGNIAFWEAPQPWGPWRLVSKKQGWPGDETSVVDPEFAFGSFSPKWLSADGRDCVFVWFRPDAWNSVACKFETGP